MADENKDKFKGKKIAIIRVRGMHGVRHDVVKVLSDFHLTRKNHCVVIDSPDKNALQKAKDYITWGEVTPATIASLEKAKGKERVFRLNNPIGGWKSVRNAFPKGDLGFRDAKINDLIAKMLH